MNFISCEDVVYEYYSYDEETEEKIPLVAVDGVTLDIQKGEFVALLGANGSGKSTLAKLLNALNIPKSGVVTVKGLSSSDIKNTREIRKSVGMVFQNPDNQIVASIVEAEVAFGVENLGIPSKEIRERVDKSLASVEMLKFLKSSPMELSGGQKQRISVAGILAMRPECIIFDESTAMLDPIGRKDVLENAFKLNKEQGMTVILITHYMDECVNADRLVIMSNGKIVEQGKPCDLLTDSERMKSLKLEVTPATELAYRLSSFGIDLEKKILTVDELYQNLMKLNMDKSKAPVVDNKRRETGEAIIELKDLCYGYSGSDLKKHAVLEHVSFDIKKGEILGIIGHTGSGKSTLIQHMNALLFADEGEVLYKGKNVASDKKELKKIRQSVGMVFQYPENQLFESNIFDEVAFGPKNMGIEGEELKERVYSSLKMVGISDTMCKSSPFALSGGQKRRVAIAGVLAMDPEVLVLDEPMAGLDPYSRKEILSNIRELNVKHGITIVIVSHSMDEIASFADRILVMNEGRVERLGYADEVFSNAGELNKIGLDVPQMTQLFDKLRESGYKLPKGVYTVDTAEKLLKELIIK